MAGDQDLTIVLTLKDRVPFTRRWLSYANASRFPFRVLIADGGADPRIQAELADHSRFPHVDYEYVRYPFDATYTEYYAKIDDALGRARTPFVVLADNDDFFVVEGLRASVSFLRGHPEYSACGGQSGVFWLTNGDLLHGRRVEWKCSLDSQSATAPTARARLREQSILTTYPVWYHVQRTSGLRERYRIVRDLGLRDLLLVEYLTGFLTVISGKTRQLDTLYLARQRDAPGSSAVAHVELSGDGLGRMLLPSWSDDFAKFVDATSAALASHDGLPLDQARRWVIESYRMLAAPALLEDVFREPTTSLRRGVRQLLRRHPPRPSAKL